MLRIFSLVGGTNPPETSGVFYINRANKWVQALQFLPEHRPRRSSVRHTISERFCPTAKRCPCHARLKIWPLILPDKATDSAPPRSLARATPSQQKRDSGALLRPTDISRPTITTPVTSPPARKISRRREQHTAEPPTFGVTLSSRF